MPLNTFALGITLGDLPEFCGPDDLTNLIVSLRGSEMRRLNAPISDEGVRRLIKLAYHTSLAAEEGRFPTFRLTNARPVDSIWSAAKFNVPLDTVESLRRLAPVASSMDATLVVEERQGGQLYCAGIAVASDLDFALFVGQSDTVVVGQSPSFAIRVDGPGEIRVSEQIYTIKLSAGRMQQVVDFGLVPNVGRMWDAIAKDVSNAVALTHGDESQGRCGGHFALSKVIHKSWSRVISSAVASRHGATFVITPSGDPVANAIHCKFVADAQLGTEIRGFWEACARHAMASNRSERDEAVREWTWRRAKVSAIASVIAGLSAVDGCVVLDRDLKVLGFGGEIRVSQDQVDQAPRKLRNLATGDTTSETELEKLGTRHRSAYRVTKVYPGTLAFVVSQDGDLRVFCSDDDAVYGFDRLHAWVKDYESR